MDVSFTHVEAVKGNHRFFFTYGNDKCQVVEWRPIKNKPHLTDLIEHDLYSQEQADKLKELIIRQGFKIVSS